MSKRFMRWAQSWIEEHIPPGANSDYETHEARTKRMSDKLFAEAGAGGFTSVETDEEKTQIVSLVMAAVADDRDFDIDVYRRKLELAQENEDGD